MVPKAVVHKKILDTAENRPDATMEEIADEVSGATVDLVERVLDEYGDPAQEPQTPSLGDDQDVQSDSISETSNQLSRKQMELLRIIYENPTASQREIADKLNVTHTTVYHRLQSVEGFDWEDRWEFVTELFDDEDQDYGTVVDATLARLESHDRTGDPDQVRSICENPRLVQKIIHTCIDSDTVTDEEIHRIVDDLLRRVMDRPE